jgi:flagellar protein FlaG
MMRVEGISMNPVTAVVKQPSPESILPLKREPQAQDCAVAIKPDRNTQKKEISEAEVIEAIEKANQKLLLYDSRVEFSIHEQTRQIMVKIYKNDEVIRELPPEKILDMVAKMMELAGILVDEKA